MAKRVPGKEEFHETLRYFRHPFLFTGSPAEIKAGLQAFLDEHEDTPTKKRKS